MVTRKDEAAMAKQQDRGGFRKILWIPSMAVRSFTEMGIKTNE